MRNAKCPFTSPLDFVARLHRAHVGECRYIEDFVHHWHASQPGSSIAQNLMSVAGAAPAIAALAAFICACAAAAAFSSAETPRFAPALKPPLAAPFDTALRRPDCTVDFSACVALVVRR